ncbi:MAG: type III pantothenate kinase [Verrucomicrobiota bacterium]
MARYLLINNNNTRTKFALADVGQLLAERDWVETRQLTGTVLQELESRWEFESVVLASVVPDKAAMVQSHFGDRVFEIQHQMQLGVALEFPDPSTIGADRLANAAGMVALFGETPAIVVDFGTAVTFDIISADRAYVGGIIAPGLDVMTSYLHERTALLPKIEIEEPEQLIGKSTRSAMLSGAVHGYRGMIREILDQLKAELAPESGIVKTVATGGYAELISAKIAAIDAVIPDLTLEGMREIANLNI